MDDGGPRPTFNQMSGVDRFTLRSATLLTSLSGIAREDTKAHPLRYPLRYPLYAAYLSCSLLPVPGAHAG